MGIPKFARFLITRYPLILVKLRNPRDIPEIDQLYLDINGIIHTVSHNNSVSTGCKIRTNEAIYYDVCCTIDRILHMIKPKKFLMISADGVAPRAKMNQQRSRRFRKTDIDPKELENIKTQGLDPTKMFNSDCISAGTEFMFNLSKYMNNFIAQKKQCDTMWSSIQVLLTGSDVPGEGEHKIIEYIRNYKTSPDYMQNTKHCVYGLDADLIMLSLITHEPNIAILREDNFIQKKKKDSSYKASTTLNEPYEIIFVSILREYMELEFADLRTQLSFEFNIERIIDDFIFFCFFIGNDFLPNLNTLDIETNALEYIFSFYRQCLPQLTDYITYHGKIDFKKAEKIFALLARQELTNLDSMLKKTETICKENEKKKKRATYEKIKVLRVKKITLKKEKFLCKIKSKPEAEIISFKLQKKQKKISKLKESYFKEMTIMNKKTYKFEDDLTQYIKRDIDSNIAKIDQPQQGNRYEIVKETNFNKNLAGLFDSDEEGDEMKKPITNPLDDIMKEATKIQRYIFDKNYCSDIKIDDISDSDVSDVNVQEIANETNESYTSQQAFDERNDLNKVFQEKLVEYYIKDVRKAKEFYYKEKLHFDITTPDGKEEQKKMFHKYLEGLQWVLYYYYRGIKSWRWFYPYHYAPMISDFSSIELEDYIDTIFENDTTKPYDPFQSLIFILPKTSFSLLPKCYGDIPSKIPIAFPDKFTVDYNGKHTPWESIVLIPFLDEKTVLDHEKNYRKLSPEEEKRDSWGESYLYLPNKAYCSSNDIKKEVYEIYKPQSNALLASNYSRKYVDYSFPTLKTVDFDFSMDQIKIYMGQTPKRTQRITICPLLKKTVSPDMIRHALLHNEIYLNYPYKALGKVVGIINYKDYYYAMDGKIYIDNKFRSLNETKEKLVNDWYKQGINLSTPNIICNVALMKMLVRNNQGQLIPVYDERNAFYLPYELTSLNSDNKDYTSLREQYLNFKKKFEQVATEYNKNDPCVIMANCYYGSIGSIVEYIPPQDPRYHKQNNLNYSDDYYNTSTNYDLEGKDWEVSVDKLYNGPLIKMQLDENEHSKHQAIENNFAHSIIRNSNEVYSSMDNVSAKLAISKWTLGVITSTLNIINCSNEVEIRDDSRLSDYEHWNIGLNIKTKTQYSSLILPGYTRFIGGNGMPAYWEFSTAAVDLICLYKQKFPWVFESLEKYYSNFARSLKFLKAYEVFCSIDDIYTKLNEVVVWLASLPVAEMKFSNNHSDYLSFSDCLKIEEYVNRKTGDKTTSQHKGHNAFGINESVYPLIFNPGYLFQETDPWIPPFTPFEPEHWFNLGDRVINIRSNDRFYVPFGLRGTVTGVANEYIEILFDEEFLGGTTCQGRFKTNKGAYVNPLNLINMTMFSPVYLRRNQVKYANWDYERTSTNYDNLNYWYGMQKNTGGNDYHGQKKGQWQGQGQGQGQGQWQGQGMSVLKNKYSETYQDNYDRKYDQSAKTEAFSSGTGTDTGTTTVKITADELFEQSSSITPTASNYSKENNQSYYPRKIIQKTGVIDKEFKTYPEGVEIGKEMNVISFDKTKKNQSEYREIRLFQNETLKTGEVYYYGKTKSITEQNPNIIFKEMK